MVDFLLAPARHLFRTRPGWKTGEPISSMVLSLAGCALLGGALVAQIPASVLPRGVAMVVSFIGLGLVVAAIALGRESLGFERSISFLACVLLGFISVVMGGIWL